MGPLNVFDIQASAVRAFDGLIAPAFRRVTAGATEADGHVRELRVTVLLDDSVDAERLEEIREDVSVAVTEIIADLPGDTPLPLWDLVEDVGVVSGLLPPVGAGDVVIFERAEGGDTWNGLPVHMFGDGPELADELLALVLEGKKTATCWSATEGLKGAEVGKRWAVKDGAGVVRCVLETTELTQRRYCDVDEALAYDEGEDDRTLESWRAAHRDYFTRNGGFSEDMLLNCERFRLLEVVEEAGR